MGIGTAPYYKCDACNYSSSNPYSFRIIEGSIKMGNQTLCKGYDFKPEVLCIDCFCGVFGIGINQKDEFRNDKRYQHIDPSYTGEDKGDDKDPIDDIV